MRFSWDNDSLYVGSALAAWARRYLDYPTEPEVPEDLAKDNRVTARTAGGAFRTDVLARGHALVADEPKAVGGEGLGPTPYDLLAAALGACTSMTLQSYAGRKGWPLEEAVVRMEHRRLYRRDEERSEHEDSRLDQLDREISLVGPLDEDQRRRLLEIADRCPVHRTLDAGIRISTREIPASEVAAPRVVS